MSGRVVEEEEEGCGEGEGCGQVEGGEEAHLETDGYYTL